LIRAGWWGSRERRGKLIERVLTLIRYHQANIADANASHAKSRKRRLRRRGVALSKCKRCPKVAL
jgi:hypothetical protein